MAEVSGVLGVKDLEVGDGVLHPGRVILVRGIVHLACTTSVVKAVQPVTAQSQYSRQAVKPVQRCNRLAGFVTGGGQQGLHRGSPGP